MVSGVNSTPDYGSWMVDVTERVETCQHCGAAPLDWVSVNVPPSRGLVTSVKVVCEAASSS